MIEGLISLVSNRVTVGPGQSLKRSRVGVYVYQSEGFPNTGYLVPARGTPGALPDGQSCWDVVTVAISWFYRGRHRPPDPPPCLSSKGVGLILIRSHTRMLGPSVLPDSNTEGLARGRVITVRSHTRMLGPSIFPDSQVTPECLVLQYFQIHRSYQNAWSFHIWSFHRKI